MNLTSNEAELRNGMFNFSQVKINVKPGTKLIILLETKNLFIDDLNISINFRNCSNGEAFTKDYECKICEPGYFKIEAPTDISEC